MSKITAYRGTTYNIRYSHTDSDGNPVSLVGCTVYFTVKTDKYDSDADDSDAVIKKTITSHTDAANGITDFEINDADTWVDPKKYYYDVIVEDADGKSTPPSLIGEFHILATRTNRQVGNE